MDKVEALEQINDIWNDDSIELYEKIENISNCFYSTGLDLVSTASYIKATPSELEALLELGGLDEEIVKKISDIDPPKTTWTMLANASDEEIEEALKVLENSDDKKQINSELVYQSMLEIAGPTVEQKLNNLNATDIKNIRIKGEQYQKLNPREVKFLKSLAPRKVKGVDLSEKQLNWLKSIVQHLIEENVISKNSMDDDQEFCDKLLDCFGE